MTTVGFKTRKELKSRRKMAQSSKTLVRRPLGILDNINFLTPLPTTGQIKKFRQREKRIQLQGGN